MRSNYRESIEEESQETSTEWFVKQQVARKVASLILQVEAVLYSQWLKGEENIVSDSLSRDAYFLSPSAHTTLLQNTVPHQLPQHFQIQALPDEISCFIASILQQLPVKKQRLTAQKPSDLVLSSCGDYSSNESDSHRIFTLMDSIHSRGISSFQLSPKQLEQVPSLDEIIKKIWSKERSIPPSHMWHRPSGQTTGRTQDWTMMENHAFC